MVNPWVMLISVAGIMFTGISLVGTAVWVVGSIKGELCALRAEVRTQIKSLTKEVGTVTESIKQLDDKHDDHANRLARLEGQRVS